MRKATRIIAAAFGAFAGFGGLEHGYFEILKRTAGCNSQKTAPFCPP